MIDVGLRTEPNLELLTEMKPSFMVWSAGYGPSPEMLARIAPGRGFNFSDGKQPLAMARKSLTEMADLLNLQRAAETHLAQYEDFIRSMKPRFVKRGARPLLLTTLIDPRHMLVFGPNSLFQEILDTPTFPNSLALSADGKTLYVSVKQKSTREKEATEPDDVIRIAL